MMSARDGIRRAIVSAMVFAAAVPALGQSYDNLVHSPDGFRGRKVLLTGKIIQSLQEGQVYTLRVNVTPEAYGLWKDTVLVIYKAQPLAARLVEGDIVDVRGTSKGIASYKAVLGQTIQLPEIDACLVIRHGGARFVSPGDNC